jgi:hypothetical protein
MVPMALFVLFLTPSITSLLVNGFSTQYKYYAFSRPTVVASSKVVVLYSSKADRNKLVGGGYPIISSGNFQLLDPEKVGLKQGTNELRNRIESGLLFSIPSKDKISSDYDETSKEVQLLDAQHWLEHLDVNIPVNIFKNTAPGSATLLGSIKIIGDDAPGDM